MKSPMGPQLERILTSKNFIASKITMEKGSEIKKHYSKVEALLVVMKGAVAFHYQEETHVLKAPATLSITPEKEHWLIALEDSELTLVK